MGQDLKEEIDRIRKEIDQKNAYQEVWIILNDLNEYEKAKIPPDVLAALDSHRDPDWPFFLNPYLKLHEMKLLPETKAILFVIYRDYLSPEPIRKEIERIQDRERHGETISEQERELLLQHILATETQ